MSAEVGLYWLGSVHVSLCLRQFASVHVSSRQFTSVCINSRQLIVESCASHSNNLISFSYSMPVFSANLVGLFFYKKIHRKIIFRKGQVKVAANIIIPT